ncbi:hypothetical protein CW751_11870 [Brumimicrobium salinarum]|uniref:Phospholipid/glycerol acyltransferase domain-containing protein n=1 Tax=Brumimicrobium salinarum TaxID=2058658 RepID=A0A2I0R0H3_9FLAO|nr:1-acyl-sn-glycerol-3-phosphate acyltransferase [Brumimicrobium salinarum]PKR80057.1 hypothetical protein CW751_11870 [Brumimicrobium salinarum]
MRPLYFLLKFTLKITLWVYYPRFKNINPPKKRFSRTIFMCNHASSFMDPLVIASSQKPIVFFMTRSDVFTPLLKPILWAAHMLPIYRKHDGEDTKKKNEEVFEKCASILKFGRGLIVFSEGFTDDVFVRRLKPVKKGAVRIGFLALERINWKKKIYVQGVGVNYSDPKVLGSDCLISNAEPVCLNDFKEAFEEDPNKTIHELTMRLEEDMRNQITDVRDLDFTDFHEHVMRLTRKGMHNKDADKSKTLIARWKYSKRLADWMNERDLKENTQILKLKNRLSQYFDRLNEVQIEEHILYKTIRNKRNRSQELFFLITLSPIVVVGLLLNYLPYKLIKNFVEKSFKRPVFWSSVKMLLGAVAVFVYNLILAVLVAFIFDTSLFPILLIGLFIIPLSGVITRNWFDTLSEFKKLKRAQNLNHSALAMERDELLSTIYKLIPVA